MDDAAATCGGVDTAGERQLSASQTADTTLAEEGTPAWRKAQRGRWGKVKGAATSGAAVVCPDAGRCTVFGDEWEFVQVEGYSQERNEIAFKYESRGAGAAVEWVSRAAACSAVLCNRRSAAPSQEFPTLTEDPAKFRWLKEAPTGDELARGMSEGGGLKRARSGFTSRGAGGDDLLLCGRRGGRPLTPAEAAAVRARAPLVHFAAAECPPPHAPPGAFVWQQFTPFGGGAERAGAPLPMPLPAPLPTSSGDAFVGAIETSWEGHGGAVDGGVMGGVMGGAGEEMDEEFYEEEEMGEDDVLGGALGAACNLGILPDGAIDGTAAAGGGIGGGIGGGGGGGGGPAPALRDPPLPPCVGRATPFNKRRAIRASLCAAVGVADLAAAFAAPPSPGPPNAPPAAAAARVVAASAAGLRALQPAGCPAACDVTLLLSHVCGVPSTRPVTRGKLCSNQRSGCSQHTDSQRDAMHAAVFGHGNAPTSLFDALMSSHAAAAAAEAAEAAATRCGRRAGAAEAAEAAAAGRGDNNVLRGSAPAAPAVPPGVPPRAPFRATGNAPSPLTPAECGCGEKATAAEPQKQEPAAAAAAAAAPAAASPPLLPAATPAPPAPSAAAVEAEALRSRMRRAAGDEREAVRAKHAASEAAAATRGAADADREAAAAAVRCAEASAAAAVGAAAGAERARARAAASAASAAAAAEAEAAAGEALRAAAAESVAARDAASSLVARLAAARKEVEHSAAAHVAAAEAEAAAHVASARAAASEALRTAADATTLERMLCGDVVDGDA